MGFGIGRVGQWIANLGKLGGPGSNPPAAAPAPASSRLPRSPRDVFDSKAAACLLTPEQRQWLREPPSAGKVGWLQAGDTRDGTADFQRTYASVRAGRSQLPPEAKDHIYLLVPGLFTEHYPGYMKESRERMASLGLDARMVPVDTDAGVAQNAAVVREAILEAGKSGRKVVLVGHSKGGVDATAALSLYPELKGHVRAVVALQSPYAGTPVATDMEQCPEARAFMQGVVTRVFEGSPQSVKDLTYEARQAFLREHPYPSDIPTLSVASTAASPLSLTFKPQLYVQTRYGEASDGLVCTRDAVIPGSSVVQLSGLDHAGSVMASLPGTQGYRPGDLMEAAIAQVLR